MIHDYANVNRAVRKPAIKRKPLPPARVAVLAGALLLGGLGVSQVVMAVAEDLKASAQIVAAEKKAEHERKRLVRLEKQRIADEKRDARRIAAARALAEKQGGYEFYEKLTGEPWAVPVTADAYMGVPPPAVNTSASEASHPSSFSLQTSMHRSRTEADSVASSLRALGYTTGIDEVKVKAGGLLFRVTVGPFPELEEAMSARDALASHRFVAQVFKE